MKREKKKSQAGIGRQLLQYKMYKYMSYELKDRQIEGDMVLYKEPTIPEEVKNYEEPVDLDAAS